MFVKPPVNASALSRFVKGIMGNGKLRQFAALFCAFEAPARLMIKPGIHAL